MTRLFTKIVVPTTKALTTPMQIQYGTDHIKKKKKKLES